MSKKFTFSLQKLLDYKEQVLETEMSILGHMRGALAKMNEELSELLREHKERSESLVRKSREGITALEIMRCKGYLKHLEQAIEQKNAQITLQRQAIEKQTDKVREAKMEISTVEKLRERKLEEYNYKESKAEELFIDEFVNNVAAV